ncbi:MAG TPA: hypothetical protein [Caudoviricetes sp.]|nr:MAG TPA: hypothetical protein [Caudoviricetes sp.]
MGPFLHKDRYYNYQNLQKQISQEPANKQYQYSQKLE